MRDLIELGPDRAVDRQVAMPVDVAPQRRDAVDVGAAIGVVQVGALSLLDHERGFVFAPALLLGERMPQVAEVGGDQIGGGTHDEKLASAAVGTRVTPGQASQRSSGSCCPARASRSGSARATWGSVATSTAPRRAIVSRLLRWILSGASGQGVRTTPATSSPADRAASRVSSVWLIVPSPGRAATTIGRPSPRARSRTECCSLSGTSQPPTPSTTANPPAPTALTIALIRSPRINGRPDSCAARCGDVGGWDPTNITSRGSQPAACASSW